MEYAGLEIPVNLCTASSFSRQIAISNAGPAPTLESMGGKRSFRCHLLNISVFHVHSTTSESAVISRPAYSVLRQFSASPPQAVSRT